MGELLGESVDEVEQGHPDQGVGREDQQGDEQEGEGHDGATISPGQAAGGRTDARGGPTRPVAANWMPSAVR